MADLDVSDVLDDPDFSDPIIITRKTQEVANSGFEFNPATTKLNIYGVVTVGSMLPMQRAADSELAKKVITVHTRTTLYAVQAGFEPDIVTWNGNNYVVKKPNNWSHFGQGFTANECEMIDTQDAST